MSTASKESLINEPLDPARANDAIQRRCDERALKALRPVGGRVRSGK